MIKTTAFAAALAAAVAIGPVGSAGATDATQPSRLIVAMDMTVQPMATGAMTQAATETGPVTVGDLQIDGAFARATLPRAPVAGGFLTVTNAGSADDKLVSAQSPASGKVTLHSMVMEGNVMKMREVDDGIAIPAGQTVVLKPGGYHLMFEDLKGPLVEGTAVAVTLTFAKAGSVEIQVPVLGIAAGAPMGGMKMAPAQH